MTMNFLEKIIQYKKENIPSKKKILPLNEIKNNLALNKKHKNFKTNISIPNQINLIAEIKHASPSRGIIRDPFNLLEIAKIYDSCGVSAISVLTEVEYFKGSIEYLKAVQSVTSIPLLMKDFIIDEYQIYEASIAGASAILLIAAILTKTEIRSFFILAHQLGMDAVVEVHDDEELEKVLSCDVDIIGVNNRNLKTFQVDLNTSIKLKKQIPPNKIIVSESGIKNREDILRLKEAGFNAVLIGETFMQSQNIKEKIEELWNKSV